ncbi:response regulator [Singulisphaera rosea]
MIPPKKTMLVVDDDRWTRFALESILKHRGWNVLLSPTVAQGLGMLEVTQPDCIILDLHLPDGSGERILRKIRDASLDIRVVVCTGDDEPRHLAQVKDLHPDGVFVKPINVDEVLAAFHPTEVA